MIRATYMSLKWLSTEIASVEDDAENIQVFVEEGTPVLLLDDFDQAEELDIEIEMVG